MASWVSEGRRGLRRLHSPIGEVGDFFARAETVDIGSWSEAETYDADRTLEYHRFAFHRVIDAGVWTTPAG